MLEVNLKILQPVPFQVIRDLDAKLNELPQYTFIIEPHPEQGPE